MQTIDRHEDKPARVNRENLGNWSMPASFADASISRGKPMTHIYTEVHLVECNSESRGG